MVTIDFAKPAEPSGLLPIPHPSRVPTIVAAEAPAASQLSTLSGTVGRNQISLQALVTAKSSQIGRDTLTGNQFELGQNFPNPYTATTTVPFTLFEPANVMLELYDVLGRKIVSVVRKELDCGKHSIALNLLGLGTVSGNYLYQLKVTTRRGTFRQSKMMVAAL